MAWTTTRQQISMGNKLAYNIEVTTDGADSVIDTGLSWVEGFTLGVVSCNTAPHWVATNSGTTGTALAGYLGCSGFTSGDNFFVLVYGR
jgi:hypothetical protein